MRDSRLDERLERAGIDLRAFGNVDRAPHVAVQAGIEEPLRIRKARPLREGQLHDLLVGLARAHDPVVRPHGRPHPLPLLDHLRIGFKDQRPHPRERRPAPIAKLGNPLIDQA